MDTQPDTEDVYSPALDRALMVAAIVHARQKRKGTEVPYVMHPMHVALLLAHHRFPEPVLVAAVLHDVVEDVRAEDTGMQQALRETFPAGLGTAPEDRDGFLAALRTFIAGEFGGEVAALVNAVTDQKHRADGTKLPWLEAKQLSHERLANSATPELAVALKTADALHNSRQIGNDLRARGLVTMNRFNASPEGTLWHYREVQRIARERLVHGAGRALVDELDRSVRELADALAEAFRSAGDRVHGVASGLPPGPVA